jgi:hypothetical protein
MKTISTAAIVAAAAMTLAIGFSGPSFAKAKKAEAPMMSPACQMDPHKEVCGVRGGMHQTYANSCYAMRDGAKVVSQRACSTHKMHKKSAKKPMKKSADKMKAAPKK